MKERITWSLLLAAAAAGAVGSHGCRTTPPGGKATTSASSAAVDPAVEPPTLRLYFVSNLAGALEPCGCTKDQLGGIDHLAAFVQAEKTRAPSYLLVEAGPVLFQDPKIQEELGAQARWKAEAISGALGDIGLTAMTPGLNDWALGGEFLKSTAAQSRAPLVAGNLQGETGGAVASVLREVAGIKVGIAGVSQPKGEQGAAPAVTIEAAAAQMKRAIAELKGKGAQILIGLAALPRGEALRLADASPELSVLVIGKGVDAGEANDAPPPPAMIGPVLVVGTSNHLQTVGVLDFHVRGNDFQFRDGTGIANADAIASLTQRIHDLEEHLAAWEKDPSMNRADLASRRGDLARLKEEKLRLSEAPLPAQGSFFRYSLVEVRGALGSEGKVHQRMLEFYRRVNDHNKVAFANRAPPPLEAGERSYVGVAVCSGCHVAPRQVWDKTAHAGAYSTLVKQFKEYNFDCVGCHVTGYEKPGGSTITENALLQGVQCEQCHGPGSAHVKTPLTKGLIERSPKPEMCVSACHHPPHVEAFDPVAERARILGPGHGMPIDAAEDRTSP